MTANNRLKAMFSLKSKITVYIPATVNINEIIDNSKYVDAAATLLSDCFGVQHQLKLWVTGYQIPPDL